MVDWSAISKYNFMGSSCQYFLADLCVHADLVQPSLVALYHLEHNLSILFACIRVFAITFDLVHTQNYVAN